MTNNKTNIDIISALLSSNINLTANSEPQLYVKIPYTDLPSVYGITSSEVFSNVLTELQNLQYDVETSVPTYEYSESNDDMIQTVTSLIIAWNKPKTAYKNFNLRSN